MHECKQSSGQSVYEHGISVWNYTRKLLNDDTSEIKLPFWWLKYKNKLFENIHDTKIIQNYTINHDCGKGKCQTIDENGKIHYPDHAKVSKNLWLQYNGDETVGRLIGNDMLCHTTKAEDLIACNLTVEDVCTHLIVALAELHANAELFGGIESDSFKIKFKRLEKLGTKLCDHYFKEHPYVYVIVRKDLSNAQKAVQSSHVCMEVARNYILKTDEHPSIIICEVRSEDKLKMIKSELDGKIKYQEFFEPDIGNQLTAIASEPVTGDQRKLFSRFQLIT